MQLNFLFPDITIRKWKVQSSNKISKVKINQNDEKNNPKNYNSLVLGALNKIEFSMSDSGALFIQTCRLQDIFCLEVVTNTGIPPLTLIFETDKTV